MVNMNDLRSNDLSRDRLEQGLRTNGDATDDSLQSATSKSKTRQNKRRAPFAAGPLEGSYYHGISLKLFELVEVILFIYYCWCA